MHGSSAWALLIKLLFKYAFWKADLQKICLSHTEAQQFTRPNNVYIQQQHTVKTDTISHPLSWPGDEKEPISGNNLFHADEGKGLCVCKTEENTLMILGLQ